MSAYLRLVPAPQASTINGGKNACKTSELIKRYGRPVDVFTDDCKALESKFWKERMVLVDIGIPYWLGDRKITGKVWIHRAFWKRLKPALAKVKAKHPDLYAILGHAGILCPRRVRGGTSPSNHSLGVAIDFTLNGSLDGYGDGKVQAGLIDLYSVLKEFEIYWGLEFGARNPRREDGMHFELCWEAILADIAAGTF